MASTSTHALWLNKQAVLRVAYTLLDVVQFSNVQTARQRKAEWFYRDREFYEASYITTYKSLVTTARNVVFNHVSG